MKTTLGLLGPLTMAAVGLLIAAPPAVAGDTTCNTGVSPVLAGPHDNVVVPQGGFCVIKGATIKGSVKALENSRLYIRDSAVGGNIDGDKADVVQIVSVTVKYGSIQIKEGGPNTVGHYEAAVCDTTLWNGNIQIEKTLAEVGLFVGNPGTLVGLPDSTNCLGNTLKRGNIKVEENHILVLAPAAGLTIIANTVGGPPTSNGPGGNLQVFKNSGDGNKEVSGNTIRQNLQCKENQDPFISAGNLAREFEDQCPQ